MFEKKIFKASQRTVFGNRGTIAHVCRSKNGPRAVSWSGTGSGDRSFTGMKFPRVSQETNERVLKQSQIPRMLLCTNGPLRTCVLRLMLGTALEIA